MYFHRQPYVPVAKRRQQSAKKIKALEKRGVAIYPLHIEGRKITKTFWGNAWCQHMELFCDYDNRLPRGRTYVRNGSVCHLSVERGKIEALVSGSSLYNVTGSVETLPKKNWQHIKKRCNGHVGSILELLQGKLSDHVMATVTDPTLGLFPQIDQLKLSCDCPDWAEMCKHIAAVLYGIGARLDTTPELLFTLRGVNHKDLIGDEIKLPKTTNKRQKLKGNIHDIFGIDTDDQAVEAPSRRKKQTTASISKQRAPSKTKAKQKPQTKPTKKTPSATFKPTAAAVRHLRKKLQMNKSQFAALLSVSPTTITLWEDGQGKLNLKPQSLTELIRANKLSVNKAWQAIGLANPS